METTVPLAIGLTAVVLLCMGALLDDRRARVRRRAQREQPLLALPLLHSINDDRCIGCEACIDVCPTEVLDLVEHKVRVSRFSDCVQCEQCANACPTQALVMYREGTTPRMLTVPELDEQFQTGVPGQYLIGEVAGKPLVKNAANLGRAVIEHIARELAGRRPGGPGGDVLDVLIVGSGPGGLSAGLSCVKHKLSCLVLEKEHVISSTVSRYPKGKHFMAEPCTSHNVSYLPVFDGTKEELVAAWTQVIEGIKLPIKLGEAVETVKRGDDGVFTIKSTVGTYRSRTVVLATGLRGKPRLLVVPGANLEKVQSLLDDPAELAGEAVLVVGGGDSAVEGAMALAEVGATVTLSYRGDGFSRCKQGNQKRLAEMVAARQLAVLLESNVKCFTPDSVTITLADKSETVIANQRAFVLIGADTPVAWLETNNVRFVERPHLYALGSSEDVVRRFAPDATACPHTPGEALAILLDRPLPRSPARRMRTVVEHVRDELREVVTSVSSAFRLVDLEPPRLKPRSSHRRTRAADDARTEEIASLRALERSPELDPELDAATEEMPSLRTLEPTDADVLSLRALDGSLDPEPLPLHTLEQTVVIKIASQDRSPSVMTSAMRPPPLPARRPPPSPVPPPVPRLPARLARGSEGIAPPHAMPSEPQRAPTAEPRRAPAADRRAAMPAARPSPSVVTSATRQVAVPARPGSPPPPLPKRPSRLPRGSSLVRQRLTPTPTLPRRQPVCDARVETAHGGGEPAARSARGTR